jgi:hypothetical protein
MSLQSFCLRVYGAYYTFGVTKKPGDLSCMLNSLGGSVLMMLRIVKLDGLEVGKE